MASLFPPGRPDLPPLPRRPVPLLDDGSPQLKPTAGRRAHRAATARRRRRSLLVAIAVLAGSSSLAWPAVQTVPTAAPGTAAASAAAPADATSAGAATRAGAAESPRARASRAARAARGASPGSTRHPRRSAGSATSPATGGSAPSAETQDTGSADRTASRPTENAPPAAGTGLEGATFYGPNAGAAAAAARGGTSPADAAVLAELARIPTATWLGAWSGDVASTVRRVVADSRVAGGVPVFVVYNIPDRDCGGHSSGGLSSAGEYTRWVEQVAAGIGSARAVVVVEPDALAQMCGDPAARTSMVRAAVEVLDRNPSTHTYLDAGHADWTSAATMAERLRAAGVAGADGFALNVSNFGTTASNVAYGRQLSSRLGGAHFIVDTSRNGSGPGDDWCNPPGRAVGERPTTRTGDPLVDAYLWVKTPGESDGACNGGPAAGEFWPEYALGLMGRG